MHCLRATALCHRDSDISRATTPAGGCYQSAKRSAAMRPERTRRRKGVVLRRPPAPGTSQRVIGELACNRVVRLSPLWACRVPDGPTPWSRPAPPMRRRRRYRLSRTRILITPDRAELFGGRRGPRGYGCTPPLHRACRRFEVQTGRRASGLPWHRLHSRTGSGLQYLRPSGNCEGFAVFRGLVAARYIRCARTRSPSPAWTEPSRTISGPTGQMTGLGSAAGCSTQRIEALSVLGPAFAHQDLGAQRIPTVSPGMSLGWELRIRHRALHLHRRRGAQWSWLTGYQRR